MLDDMIKCVIMPLFAEVIDKPHLKPLDSHYSFDLAGSHLLCERTHAGGVLTDERAAGIWGSIHFMEHEKYLLYLWHKLLGVPFISPDPNGAVDNTTVPVLMRV